MISFDNEHIDGRIDQHGLCCSMKRVGASGKTASHEVVFSTVGSKVEIKKIAVDKKLP